MKRFFDIIFSATLLVILLPLFLLIACRIFLDRNGPVFYVQKRVGRNNRDFNLIKFRTMVSGSDKSGLLTVGSGDSRITSTGRFLRKFKLDELPQLINVLMGQMSMVGPRPEVRRYVDYYTREQLEILSVRPGITDPVSLAYFNESDLLAQSSNPEKTYLEEVLPRKLELSLAYVKKAGLIQDFAIVCKTFLRVFKG